jgi:hypothetical protein
MESMIESEKKIIKKKYEQSYINKEVIRKNTEIVIEEKNIEIKKLKLIIKSKEIIIKSKERELEQAKKIILSNINSQTAKNGYKEENLVCNDLKNKLIRDTFFSILGNDYDDCSRITGNHKCDIQSKNKILNGQVKKYKVKQFQQLDRHWIANLIKNIPELNNVSQILKDLCEYPLLPNGTHIDRSKTIKKLSHNNYTQEKLNNFLKLLNEHKRKILNYAFLGTNVEIQPEYLFGVEYIVKKRTKIILFKIKDIIDYLEKLDFKVSPQKTVILLGNDRIISLQRKGGDRGRKSSNQLQIKITLSELTNKVTNLQYKL